LYLRLFSGAGYAEFDDLSLSNLSILTLTPRLTSAAFAGLTFAQASAAWMPWAGTTKINTNQAVQMDGTADFDAGSLAVASYKGFHAAVGSSFCAVIAPDTTSTGERVILDSCNATNAGHGIYFAFDAANQRILFKVGNGSGTWLIDAATANGSCTRNATHVVDVVWSEAGGYSVVIDGGSATTGASSGSASTSNPAGFRRGATTGGANFFAGRHGPIVALTGAATAEIAGIRTALRTWAGV
jgi:hypothetical protein